MTTPLPLALALALSLALPAYAARPAKRTEAAAVTKTLGTWKVRCYAPAAGQVRRCTLARGYVPPILEFDDRGLRLVEGEAKAACGAEPWRYKVDGKDLAKLPAADRAKALLAGHALTRERPLGRRCTFRRERVNIAGIGRANRLFLETWVRFRAATPSAPRG